MINSIQLKNFESHKDSKLEFCPGVNVISGSSGHGKSSIVKAFDLVFNNKPAGNPFVSTFAKKNQLTIVDVETTDGCIRREKNKTINQYIINNDDKNPLKALRSDLPSKVKEISKIENINIQKQIDQFFLLDKSPGKVAKEFNEVAGLKVMDKALGLINSEVRDVETKIKIRKEKIKEIEEEIDKISWVEKANKELLEIEKIEKDIDKTKEKHISIKNKLSYLHVLTKKLNELEYIEQAEYDIKDIFKKINEIKIINQKRDTIKKPLSKIELVRIEIHNLPDLEKIQKDYVSLCSTIKEKEDLALKIKSLKQTVKSVDLNAFNLKAYKGINSAQKHLKALQNTAENEIKEKNSLMKLNKILNQQQKIKKQITPIKKQIKTLKKEQQTFKDKIKICPTCRKPF